MTKTLCHLHRLYADTDDPWNFDKSPYEQAKFIATRNALTRDQYRSALEIGCGNGALARHLAPRCSVYIGIDAVERAVDAARQKVPDADFIVGCYPCPLPNGDHDLLILSEFLYFLTPSSIAQLCRDVTVCAPRAEVLCITYLEDTGLDLQGVDALELFRAGMREHLALTRIAATDRYRIDRGIMRGAA